MNPITASDIFSYYLAWDKIRDGIVGSMESIRANRIEQEHINTLSERRKFFRLVYTAWYVKQEDKGVLPRMVDFMHRPEVRALLEQDTKYGASRADFEVFTSHFAEWAAEWKAQCTEKLRKLVRDSPELEGKIPDGVDPLSLASVVYACKQCPRGLIPRDRCPMLYPAILAHHCLYEVGASKCAASGASENEDEGFNYPSWSLEPIEAVGYHKEMVEIIEAFGRDPSKATQDEMNAIDNVRLHCFDCPWSESGYLAVMGWKQAVMSHNLQCLCSTHLRAYCSFII